MGYACPVCSDPQADAGHLANHLAFTAMLGDDDHETWLEEHATGWADMGERELAAAVSERVEETDFPQLFEDTVGGLGSEADDPPGERSGALFDDHGHTHDHDHGNGHAPDRGDLGPIDDASTPVDDETERVLEEAREMTRRMLDDEEGSGE